MADMVSFRAGPLADEIDPRTGHGLKVGAVAQRDLGRYYELLNYALATVQLSQAEAMLIVDACNGTLFEPFSIGVQVLTYDVQDSLEDGYATKWGVDGEALVKKLAGYSTIQRAAICDAIERFWGNTYHIENTAARLVRVGLVKRAD